MAFVEPSGWKPKQFLSASRGCAPNAGDRRRFHRLSVDKRISVENKGAWLRAGTHVNLVGSHMPNKREADTALIGRSAVYVDVIESALSEAGDLLMPIQEGAFSADVIRGEIGALASGRIAGRRNQEEVTVYKSLGVFAQDLLAGWRAYERALALGEGTEISL